MRQESQHWDKIKATLEEVSGGTGQTGLSPTVAVKRLTDGQWLQAGGGSWGAGFAVNSMTEPDTINMPGRYEYSVPLARLTYTQGLSGYVFKVLEAVNGVLQHVEVTCYRSEWDELRADHVTALTFGAGVHSVDVLSGGIAAASFAAGAITAASIATDAIGAAELASSAVDKIADQVWDELLAGHTTAGSSGKTLSDLGAFATPGAVAAAVWEEAKSGHVSSGTFGHLVQAIAGMVQINHRLLNPTFDAEGRMLTAEYASYPTGADALADSNRLVTLTSTWTYDVDGNVSTHLSRE